MRTTLLAALLLCGNVVNAQTISVADFKALEGKWKGKLTYLDYSSNKPTSIPTKALIELVSDTTFDLFFYYTEEPDKNEGNRYIIQKNGTALNGMKVIERAPQADGTLKIVLENKGPDGNDNRPATFHQVMMISATHFTSTKMVKFDGENEFFQRNQYLFTR